MARLVTFQAIIDEEAVEDFRRAVDVLVEDLQEEEWVDDAWALNGEAKVVIASEGGDPRIYGPFRNDSEADQAASEDQIVAALHEPDALTL